MSLTRKEEFDNKYPKEVYLDENKTIKVEIFRDSETNKLKYRISAPSYEKGYILEALQKATEGKVSGEKGEFVEGHFKKISGVQVLRFASQVALKIDEKGGNIEVPKITRAQAALMSQSGDEKALEVVTGIEYEPELALKTDLHSHFTGMLKPEEIFSLGLKHNVNYHAYYIYLLGLDLTEEQEKYLLNRIVSLKDKETKESYYSAEEAEKIMELLEKNKGNKKKISEILEGTPLKERLVLPITSLVLDGPKDKIKGNIQKILESFSLPKEAQNTFSDMTTAYLFRFPFTNGKGNLVKQDNIERQDVIMSSDSVPKEIKEIFLKMCQDRENPDFRDNDLQKDFILTIFRQAQEQGLDYIEMSHNILSKPEAAETINLYNDIFGKIEEEGKPKLRFLAGISRFIYPKVAKKTFECLKKTLESKYVTGIDFLGEELNETEKFSGLLKDITEYAMDKDPDMVIRVHSGETKLYGGNIIRVLEVVYGVYADKVEEAIKNGIDPKTILKPNLRIGHGIYGADEKDFVGEESKLGEIIARLEKAGVYERKPKIERESLLKFMGKMDLVIERNPTSNILLSHKSSIEEDPLQSYLDAGIKCVIGTDGYGIYGTSIEEEQMMLSILGLEKEYIQKIREAEKYVQERSARREKTKTVVRNNEVSERNKTTRIFENFDKTYRPSIIGEDGKENIVVSGGSFNEYDTDGNYKITKPTPEGIQMIASIMENLDPEKNRFVIGGRIEGYERQILELNKKRIKEGKEGFEIILITNSEKKLNEEEKLLEESGCTQISSGEKSEFATYKKINSEFFSQDVPTTLLVLDGSQVATNLITDANNGKNNKIFVSSNINQFINEKINVLKDVKIIFLNFSLAKVFARELNVQDMNTDIAKLMSEMARDLPKDKDRSYD